MPRPRLGMLRGRRTRRSGHALRDADAVESAVSRRCAVTVPDNAAPFVGRHSEIALLRAELATVRAGQPRLVLVDGPAGIGKSAVLDHFLSEETDLTVLRATGEQWEAFVAFGVADQLMRRAGVSNSRLLASRNRSLPAEEPVGVGVRILESLEDLEQKAPVVIVIDDAHWADVDSLRALLFVVRRLVGERVLTVLAQRSEEAPRLPEMPEERWRTWEPVLPAPGAFAMRVVARLDACSPAARRLVEAAAVLGGATSLNTAAALAEVTHPVDPLDEAVDLNLLQLRADSGVRDVTFSHPLVQAAVYEQLGPAGRVRLHSVAAGLVDDEASALRHRVMAVTPPDPELVSDLDAFARRQATVGAWSGAAWALVEGSRLSPDRTSREQRLLRAVDAMTGAGDLIQAEAFAREAVAFAPGPLRNAALGYLAVLRGQPVEAERLLRAAWDRTDDADDASLRAVVAQRSALHAVGRLRGPDVVDWAQRALDLALPGDPVRVEAQALLGLRLGWQGRLQEGLAAYDEILDNLADEQTGPPLERVHMARGWLLLVGDDVVGAHQLLARAAPAAAQNGTIRIAVWSYVWLARAGFALGAWDEAAADAERAVSLLEESGHGWLRQLARFAAGEGPGGPRG